MRNEFNAKLGVETNFGDQKVQVEEDQDRVWSANSVMDA